MVDSKYMGIPFGTSGDKATIPEATQPGGQVSYQQGFGPDYERDPATDPLAKRVPRDETNEFYFQVSNAIKFLQLYGAPEWYALDGAGNQVAYPLSARVRRDAGTGMQVWKSLVANNTSTPGSDPLKWALEILVVPASFTEQGIAELATISEARGRVDTSRIITPFTLGSVLDIAGLGVPLNSLYLSTPGAVSWSCPPDVTRARFRLWGGGGGSGGASNGGNSGGGGGGGYAEKIVSVIPGQVYSGSVGAGGNPGGATASPTAGGTGGTTSIAGLSASGGAGGTPSSATPSPGAGGASGTGTNGSINVDGGPSSSASFVYGMGGSNGGGAYGTPGIPANGFGANGYRGNFPAGGAGGTGAQNDGSNYTGGRGANGLIIIDW